MRDIRDGRRGRGGDEDVLGGAEIGRRRGGADEGAAGARMDDLQNVGVKHLAGDLQLGRQPVAGAAVGRVADDGMAEVGEVDADLVGAAGFDADAQEGCQRPGGEDFVVRDGGPAFFRDGHFLAVDGMAADGQFHGAGRFFEGAPDEG